MPEVGAKMPSQITNYNAVYSKFCVISNKKKERSSHTETAKSFLFFIGVAYFKANETKKVFR